MVDSAPSPERLASVARALSQVDLSQIGGDAETLRAEAEIAVSGYLLPRVENPHAGLVVAMVGVSGSGKSTLVNSLAGRRITETGSLRPTTTEPVAWGGRDLPPTLDMLRGSTPGRRVETLVPPASGLTIVDTPPPAVRNRAGRPIVSDVLASADVCVLVAGGQRYADAAGFELAELAAHRGLPTIFVLNRLPATPEIQQVLMADYAAKLAGRGLIPRPDVEAVVGVAEGPIVEGREALPGDWITGVRKEVQRLADEGAAVVDSVVAASAAALSTVLVEIRSAAFEAEARRAALRDPVVLAYDEAAQALVSRLHRGEFAPVAGSRGDMVGTLAAASARAAGRAAQSVSERWIASGVDVPAELFGHASETVTMGRERVEWWDYDIPRLALEIGGPRHRKRRTERLVAAVRREVFGGDPETGRSIRRLLRRHPGLVDAARGLLAEELAGIVRADSGRFLGRLGPGTPHGVLADLQLGEGA